jgi:hypothetical protein
MPVTLATWDSEIWRIAVQGQPSKQFMRPPPHLQNNQSKMDWRFGSSSRVPTLQVWSPEFKWQSHQNKKSRTSPRGIWHVQNLNSLYFCHKSVLSVTFPQLSWWQLHFSVSQAKYLGVIQDSSLSLICSFFLPPLFSPYIQPVRKLCWLYLQNCPKSAT